jgi:hypothetical protein
VRLIRGVFHLHISFSYWFRGIRVFSVFPGVSSVSTRDAEGPGHCGLGVFIAEEVDGVGDKGSGYNTRRHW